MIHTARVSNVSFSTKEHCRLILTPHDFKILSHTDVDTILSVSGMSGKSLRNYIQPITRHILGDVIEISVFMSGANQYGLYIRHENNPTERMYICNTAPHSMIYNVMMDICQSIEASESECMFTDDDLFNLLSV